MISLFSRASRNGRPVPTLSLSASSIDETAARGTLVGLLAGPTSEWAFRLADDADGMFALEENRVLVGPAPLSQATAPEPKLLVAATDGRRAMAELMAIEVRRALAPLPLAMGARVAAIGDSQIGYNSTFGAAVGNGGSNQSARAAMSTGYGFIELAQAQDARFRFDNWFDPTDPRGLNHSGAAQGIHGDHLDWRTSPATYGGGILGRLPALLARRPDILILQGGINTIATGDDGTEGTAGYVVAKLDLALRLARRAGVWTLPMTIYPRGDWIASGDAKTAVVDEVNAWIRAQVGRSGVLGVLDAEDILRPAGVFAESMFKSDKVHLSPKGALAVGVERLLPLLQAAIVPGSTFDQDPAVGNLLPPALYNMLGSTGTKQFNGITNGAGSATGSVATGYTLNMGRNAAVVASKGVVAGVLEQQILAISPGGAQSGAYGELTLSGIVAAEPNRPGQWYQALLEVETSGDGLSFAQLQGGLRDGTNATVTQTIALGRESSVDFATTAGDGARTFWLATEPFMSPLDGYAPDRLDFRLLLTFSKTAPSFVVKVRRPILRRIEDPRPAWGY